MRFRKFDDEARAQLRSVMQGVFVEGQCAALAMAIHRRTGWSPVAVRSSGGELLHAGVLSPDGAYVDVRGRIDEATFVSPHCGTVSETDEKTLLIESPYSEEDDALARADRLAGLLVDGLPGESEHERRLRAFADGLEALCRETGIWIRSEGPHGIPIYPAYGDEKEFEISFDPMGAARIDRTL